LKKNIHDIILVGAGNVATHLGRELNHHFRIKQVYSRSVIPARKLADLLQTNYTTDLIQLDYSADVYLFCLQDDALLPVLRSTRFDDQLLIHTSGSQPMSVFKGFSKNYGVLYPVQTFTMDRIISLENVPVCIEGNNPENNEILEYIGLSISGKVMKMDSDKRKILHLSAVFACNFSNHMYALAEKLLKENDMDFELLKPLILETANKIEYHSPVAGQTGPAVRGDTEIIQDHIGLLANSPELQKIYTFVSNSIASISGEKESENRT